MRRQGIEPQRTHFVVVTIGSAGDLFPFLRMALALREAGHTVSFLAPDLLEPYVSQAGLPFHGLPIDPAVLDDPDLWDARKGFGVVWRATRPAAAQLLPFVAGLPADRPCVLLVHPLALPEADLCRAARPDLRIAAAYLAPSNLPTIHDPLVMGPLRIAPWVPHARAPLAVAPRRRALDRPARAAGPERRPRAHTACRRCPACSAICTACRTCRSRCSRMVRPRPAGLAAADAARRFSALRSGPRPRARAGAGALPRRRRRADRVHAGHRQPPGRRSISNCALIAVRKLGRRAIFLTAHAEQVPPGLPPEVLWQAYVPLRALLPQVAALVHHGGIGTTAEALRAGTPQLVAPFAHDQFDNAARVEALGVGLALPAARLNPRLLEQPPAAAAVLAHRAGAMPGRRRALHAGRLARRAVRRSREPGAVARLIDSPVVISVRVVFLSKTFELFAQ